MKLIQADESRFALILDQQTQKMLIDSTSALLKTALGTYETRSLAAQFLQLINSKTSLETQVFFEQSFSFIVCPYCKGSTLEKIFSSDQNLPLKFIDCYYCQGEGKLFVETIRKGFVPTQTHYHNFAK